MTSSGPPGEYYVFQTRWRFFLAVAAFCWMAGVPTFFMVKDQNTPWYYALIPSLLAAPFVGHFTYLGLRKEPLLIANRECLILRNGLFPWRLVSISWCDVISIRGIAGSESTFEELAIELCRPLERDVPKLWRLRRGNTYYFPMGSDTPAPVVASNLRPYLEGAPRPQTLISSPPEQFRTVWTVAYGLFNLAVAACLFVLAIVWQRLPIAVQFPGVPGFVFLGACVCFIPFIHTYGKLGLNSGEGPTPPEIRRRHAELRRASPTWALGWYVGIGSLPGVFVLAAVTGMSVEPIFAVCGAVTFLSGMWFLFGYPAAGELFGS